MARTHPAAAVGFALSLPCAALAQAMAAPPEVHLGDTWIYVRHDESRFSQVVIDHVGDEFTVASGRRTVRLDGTLEDAARKRIGFPLAVGNQWTVEYPWKSGQLVGSDHLTRRVVAYEKVSVPAGAFDAFRIESEGRFQVDNDPGALAVGAAGGQRVETYWYAPSAKRIVKFEGRNRASVPWARTDFESGYQLLRMRLAPAIQTAPLAEGNWRAAYTGPDGRTFHYTVVIHTAQGVWSARDAGASSECEFLSAPIQLQGDAPPQLRVQRSVPATKCTDLLFSLTREGNSDAWKGRAADGTTLTLTRN